MIPWEAALALSQAQKLGQAGPTQAPAGVWFLLEVIMARGPEAAGIDVCPSAVPQSSACPSTVSEHSAFCPLSRSRGISGELLSSDAQGQRPSSELLAIEQQHQPIDSLPLLSEVDNAGPTAVDQFQAR